MMNIKGKGPNLTTIVIGIAIFLGLLALIFSSNEGIYNTFMIGNAHTVDADYLAFYENASSNKQYIEEFDVEYAAESGNFVQSSINLGSALLTTLSLGFAALKTFLTLPNTLLGVINSVTTVIPEIPATIIGLLTLVASIFIFSKLLKAKRGTSEEP